MHRTLVLIVLALLAPFAATQAIVHVSPTGDDTAGDGSVTMPFRSVDRALLAVVAGGTVRAMAGSYPHAVTIDKSVTIDAYDDGGVPVLGPRPTPGAIVTVAGVPDVTLRGVALLGQGGQDGVLVLGPSDRFAAVDCSFSDLGGDGVRLAGLQSVDARVDGCRFVRVRNAAAPVAAIVASGTPRLSISRCEVRASDFGVRLLGVPAAAVVDSTFVDLAQSAVLAVASPDLLVQDVQVIRCAHFATPSAWASPADQFGAVALAGLGHRAVLRRVLVDGCGGYLGDRAVFGSYDGCFGVSIDACDDVLLDGCALHRNEFGGLRVTGGSVGTTVSDTSIVANGARNGTAADVGLYADVGSVVAGGCFWGVPAGPAFDGDGPGNGIAGTAAVATAPIAARPTLAVATSLEFESALPGGLRARALEIVDLDGDGRSDVVAVEDLTGYVRVHLRSGGGFAAPRRTNVGGLPVAVAPGRFDADAFVDLAVVDELADRVVVLFGDGAGGFPRRAVVAVPRRPLRVRAAELDASPGDDLLIACVGDVFGAGGLVVARADGAGGFATSELPGATAPTDVAAVDLDADGRLDVVAYDVDRAGPGLRSWRNLGGGGFAPLPAGPVDPGPVLDATLAPIDVDGVGGSDLAVARFTLFPAPGTTTIDVHPNDGSGALLAPVRFDEVIGPVEMAAGDVGDRGSARLCVALPALGEVRAYGPVVAPATPYAPFAELLLRRAYPQSVAVGELTDDAAADLLVADAATGDLEIWRGRLDTRVETYGSGCPGERGTPRPWWRSVPELGASSFGVGFEDGPTVQPAFLLISILPAAFPIDGGCSLLVQPAPFALATTSDAAGYGSVQLAVPVDRSLLRGELFAQWWLFDPAGSAFAALSSSAAVRIRVGG